MLVRNLWVIILVLAVAIGFREMFPKTIVKPSVPRIITKYDTVTVTPDWLSDSIKKWKKVRFVTDTVNIYHTVTVIDTIEHVDSTLKPVTLLSLGRKFGDTGFVVAGNIVSKFLTPGMLVRLEADTGVPRMDFVPFQTTTKSGASIFSKILYAGIGFAACKVAR